MSLTVLGEGPSFSQLNLVYVAVKLAGDSSCKAGMLQLEPELPVQKDLAGAASLGQRDWDPSSCGISSSHVPFPDLFLPEHGLASERRLLAGVHYTGLKLCQQCWVCGFLWLA